MNRAQSILAASNSFGGIGTGRGEMQLIGTKQGPNGGGEGDGLYGDTSHRTATSRFRIDMPNYDVILKGVEYWNGYIKFNGADEAAGPNSLTNKAAWEPDGAAATIPLWGGGVRTATIAAGSRRIFIPEQGVIIPGGSLPYVRQLVTVADTPWQWPASRIAHGSVNSLDESDNQFGTGAGTDQVDVTGTFGSNSATYAWGPCAIYGVPADGQRRRAVALFQDSMGSVSGGDGAPDYGDSAGRAGFIERALGTSVAWTNAARASSRLQWVAAGMANQIAMTAPYVTSAIIQLGRNDITNSRSLVNLQDDFTTVAGWLQAYGVKVFATTITPKPLTTADAGLDGGSSVSAPQETIRIDYNTWLKTLPVGIRGCFDVAATVEDSGRPGYFTPSNPAISTDLTHLTATGIALAQAAIDLNKLA